MTHASYVKEMNRRILGPALSELLAREPRVIPTKRTCGACERLAGRTPCETGPCPWRLTRGFAAGDDPANYGDPASEPAHTDGGWRQA